MPPGPPRAHEDGLLTSDGTVYPLLNRLRDAGLVTSEWHDAEGQRARRYYSITEAGTRSLKAFRAEWDQFSTTVARVLHWFLLVYRLEERPRNRGLCESLRK